MHNFHLNYTEVSCIIMYRSSLKKGGNPQNFDSVMAPFLLRFRLNICVFQSITYEGMQQFYSNFTER